MATFEKGTWAWLQDEDECYVPVQAVLAFKAGSAATVRSQDGRERELSAAQTAEGSLAAMDEQSLTPQANMVNFDELTEAALLHNLRQRFALDEIYTSVGSILVATNPFKQLPIYTPDVMLKYINSGGKERAGRSDPLPPHCWQVAIRAYRALSSDFSNQAVCISGESGAGKTESMKLILQALAQVSAKAARIGAGDLRPSGTRQIEQLILSTNPVTEAFGNAKTVRNNNSSRFGKWTTLSFSRSGRIVGGSITSYLLEKSRVVFQAIGERNYHAFYQLLAGSDADAKVRAELSLGTASDYRYLQGGGSFEAAGINDAADYGASMDALHALGLPVHAQTSVMRTLGAILHLGNITFEAAAELDETATIHTDGLVALEDASRLLGAPPGALQSALTSKNIGSRSVILVPFTVRQAEDARDALAKALYGKLFDFLINRICISLSNQMTGGIKAARRASLVGSNLAAAATTEAAVTSSGQIAIIGVLDIFGFESFDANSFEQLCINYTNEKLQFHFNEHVFTIEQAEYVAEGVDVSKVTFTTNAPVLELIEAPAGGLFAMLDEEVVVPKGSDESFRNKLLQRHAVSHERLSRPKPKARDADRCFGIVHFAGEVQYNVAGFLEKNKDFLLPGLEAVVKSSDDVFTASLFADLAGADTGTGTEAAGSGRLRRRGKKKLKTLASGFKRQLATLMSALGACEPHFIRCLKPNVDKVGNRFDAKLMMAQLRYAGVLEVCRIRQLGFPHRRSFAQFVHRYGALVPAQMAGASFGTARKGRELGRGASAREVPVAAPATQEQCIALCRALQECDAMGDVAAAHGGWAVGKSKVFLRAPAQRALDLARDAALDTFVVVLQCAQRRRAEQQRHRARLDALRTLADATKARDLDALTDALGLVAAGGAAGLPFDGAHVPAVSKARTMQRRLEQAQRIADALAEAVSNVRAAACSSAAVLHRLLEEAHVFDDQAPDGTGRVLELVHADALALATSTIQQIEEQDASRAALRKAIESNQPHGSSGVSSGGREALEEALKAAEACGLDRSQSHEGTAGDGEYEVARALLNRMEEEEAVIIELEAAAESRQLKSLNALLTSLVDLGMDKTLSPSQQALVDRARGVQSELKALQAVRYALRKAVTVAERTRESGPLRRAIAEARDADLGAAAGGKGELSAAEVKLRQLDAADDVCSMLRNAIEAQDESALTAALEAASSVKMPAGLELIAEAEAVVARQRGEASALAALRKVVAAGGTDTAALDAAVERATDLWGDGKDTGRTGGHAEVTNLLERAVELQQGTGAKAAALRGVAFAVEAIGEVIGGDTERSAARGALEAALTTAVAAGCSAQADQQLKQARELLAALDERAAAEVELRTALGSSVLSTDNTAVLEAKIAACSKLGLNNDNSAALKAARSALTALRRKMTMTVSADAVLLQLQASVDARDVDGIGLGVMEALRKGVDSGHTIVAQARALMDQLQAAQAARSSLARAVTAAQSSGKLGGAGAEIGAALAALEQAGGPEAVGAGDAVAEARAAVEAARGLQQRMATAGNITATLRAAITSRDPSRLEVAMESAASLAGMTTANNYTYRQAHALAGQLFIERNFTAGVDAALIGEDLHRLHSLLVEAQRLGLSGTPVVRRARKAAAELSERQRVAFAVSSALQSQHLTSMVEALERADAISLQSPSVEQLRSLVHGQGSISELLAALRDAASRRDLGALDRLLVQARAIAPNSGTGAADFIATAEVSVDVASEGALPVELRDNVVTEALVLRERLIVERSTEAALVSASLHLEECMRGTAPENVSSAHSVLMEAIADAMQANVGGEKLTHARDVANAAGGRTGQIEALNAALIGADLALRRPDGVFERDVVALQSAIDVARTSGQCQAECDESEDTLQLLRRHLAVEQDLSDALKLVGDEQEHERTRALHRALVVAGELGLESSIVARAAQELRAAREAEALRAMEPDMLAKPDTDALMDSTAGLRRHRSDADAEVEWSHKLQAARSPDYEFSRYERVRVGADFATGAPGGAEGRREAVRQQLAWQPSPLHKSVSYLDGDGPLNAAAKHMHTDILGFCGDIVMSFPHMLAHDLLKRGNSEPRLRDEIFLQLLKHLSGAPTPKSILRGWQLLSFCLHCFPPSPAFDLYLLHFLVARQSEPAPVGPFVVFAMEKLRASVFRGASLPVVPSVEELDAMLPKAVHLAVRRGSLLVRQKRVEAYLLQEKVFSVTDAVGMERAQACEDELEELRAVYALLLQQQEGSRVVTRGVQGVQIVGEVEGTVGSGTGNGGALALETLTSHVDVMRQMAEGDVSVEVLQAIWALTLADLDAAKVRRDEHGASQMSFFGFVRFLARLEGEFGEPLEAAKAHVATSSVDRAESVSVLKTNLLGGLRATLTYRARVAAGAGSVQEPIASALRPVPLSAMRDAEALRRGLQRIDLQAKLAKRTRRASLIRTGMMVTTAAQGGKLAIDPRARRVELRLKRQQLGRALQRRPSREEVEAQGILYDVEDETGINAAQQRNLARETLRAGLARRPSKAMLTSSGILLKGGTDSRQLTAERGMMRSNLHRKLNSRPGMDELKRRGLLGTGTDSDEGTTGGGADPASNTAETATGNTRSASFSGSFVEHERISKQLSEALVAHTKSAMLEETGMCETDALAILFQELAGATELLALEQLHCWSDLQLQLSSGVLYEEDLRNCFRSVDVDADGQITFSEFLLLLDGLEQAKATAAHPRATQHVHETAADPLCGTSSRRASLVHGRRISSLRMLGAHRGQTESLKGVLVTKLQHRATLEQMQRKGVWKSAGVSPAAAMLERNLLANKLKAQLQRRPSAKDLFDRGILVEKSAQQATAQRNLQRTVLTRQLGLRPEREQLESQGILRVDSGRTAASEMEDKAKIKLSLEESLNPARRPSAKMLETQGLLRRVDPVRVDLERSLISDQLSRALQRRPSRAAIEAEGMFDDVDEFAVLFGAICDEGEEVSFDNVVAWDVVGEQLDAGTITRAALVAAWESVVEGVHHTDSIGDAEKSSPAAIAAEESSPSSFFGEMVSKAKSLVGIDVTESPSSPMNFSQFLSFLEATDVLQKSEADPEADDDMEDSAAEKLRKRRLFLRRRAERQERKTRDQRDVRSAETLKDSLLAKIRSRPDLQELRRQYPALLKGGEGVVQTPAQAMLERNLISANLKHALARRVERGELERRGVLKAGAAGMAAAGAASRASDLSSLATAAAAGQGGSSTGDMGHLLNRAMLSKKLARPGRPSITDLEAQGIYKPQHRGGGTARSAELEANMQRALLGRKLQARPLADELRERGIMHGERSFGMEHKMAGAALSRALDPARRASMHTLEQMGIVKPHAVSSQHVALERGVLGGRLNRSLAARPSPDDVLQRGIMPGQRRGSSHAGGASGVDPAVGGISALRAAAALQLERQILSDTLGKKLAMRPDVAAVRNAGILVEQQEDERQVLSEQLERALGTRASASMLAARNVLRAGSGTGVAAAGGSGGSLELERATIAEQLQAVLVVRPSRGELRDRGLFVSEQLAIGFKAVAAADECATLQQILSIDEIAAEVAAGTIDEVDLERFFTALDTSKSGTINFSQFLRLVDELSQSAQDRVADQARKESRRVSLAKTLAEAMRSRPALKELQARGVHRGDTSAAAAMLERNLIVAQLKAKIVMRPPREQLAAKGLLLEDELDSHFASTDTDSGPQVVVQDERRQSTLMLAAALGKANRPQLDDLKEQGIIRAADTRANALERRLVAKTLKNQLRARPTRSELEARGVLQAKTADSEYVLLLDQILDVAGTLHCTSSELKALASVV